MSQILEVLMKFSGDSSGARKETRKLGSEQKKTLQKAKADFAQFAKVSAAAAAVVTGILVKITTATAKMGDEFHKASLRTGESAETLSQLKFAAERSGTSFQVLEKSLLVASRRLVEAERGSATAVDTFKQLGISIYDSEGNLKSASSLMSEFAEVTKDWEDDTRKAALAQELFGRGGAELLPLMSEGADGIQKLRNEADQLGFSMSDAAAAQGADFQDRVENLDSALTGLRNNIGTHLMPVLAEFITQLTDIASGISEIISQGEKMEKINQRAFQSSQDLGKNISEIAAEYRALGGDWDKDIAKKLFTSSDAKGDKIIISDARERLHLLIAEQKNNELVKQAIAARAQKAAEVREKEKQATKQYTETQISEAARYTEILKGFENEKLKNHQRTLQSEVQSQRLSFDRRRAAAEKLFLTEQQILEREKQSKIAEIQNEKISDAQKKQIIAQYTQFYATEQNKLKSNHQIRLDEIEKAERESKERIKQIDADLTSQIRSLDIAAMQADLNDEKKSASEKVKIALKLLKLKLDILEEEMKAKREALKAEGKATEEIDRKITELHKKREEVIRQEAEKTIKTIKEGQKSGLQTFLEGAIDVTNEIYKWSGGVGQVLSSLGLMNSELAKTIEGVQGIAGGIGQIASGDILGGAASVISGIASVFDGLTESWDEGFYKQFGAHGFDDQYSEELLKKMEKDADAGGSKEAGVIANIEDFFKETTISTEGEFQNMSNYLNQAVDEYIKAGHTTEEAYEKFGDELEQLRSAQEQYGFETTEALEKMLHQQKYGTKEGRLGAYGEALDQLDKVFQGMAGENFSPEAWQGTFGLVDRIFRKMQKEGYSMQEIFSVVGPKMEKILKTAEEEGVDTSGMQQMKAFYEKMQGAGGLLDVLSGLESTIEIMASTGTLTKTNLENSAKTAEETYQKLLQKGFTEDQALAQLAPLLAQMQETAEARGWELPAEIAEKIEDATEKGLMPQESVPEKLDTLNDTFTEGVGRIVDAILGDKNSRQSFALGGLVKGGIGNPVTVDAHGGEYVLNHDAVKNIGASTLSAMNNSGAIPTNIIPVPSATFVSQQQESTIADLQAGQKETAGVLSELKGKIANLGEEFGARLKEALPNMGTTRVQSVLSIDQKKLGEVFTEMLNNQTVIVYADQVRSR